MKKFIIRFAYQHGEKVRNYKVASRVRPVMKQGYFTFNLSENQRFEEEAQKAWDTICENSKFNKYNVPKFKSVEVQKIIDWQPSKI